MIYLKWKLADDGTGPEQALTDAGNGQAYVGPALDEDFGGYRIGYLDPRPTPWLDGLEKWDVTQITEAEALEAVRVLDPDAEIGPAGYFIIEPEV